LARTCCIAPSTAAGDSTLYEAEEEPSNWRIAWLGVKTPRWTGWLALTTWAVAGEVTNGHACFAFGDQFALA
jgi:hypothetical protein